MNTTDGYEVNDIHYASESPLADAMGKLLWEGQIVWFHNFGLTHIGDRRHLLRIGLPERTGAPAPYAALLATIFTPGGLAIAHQEFPFYNYDSVKGNAAKQISLTLIKDKYSFFVGASVSSGSPREAGEKDLQRLSVLCKAVFRWATLLAGGTLKETQRHLGPARTVGKAEPAIAATATAPRKSMSTDQENIVVLDDDAAHSASDEARV